MDLSIYYEHSKKTLYLPYNFTKSLSGTNIDKSVKKIKFTPLKTVIHIGIDHQLNYSSDLINYFDLPIDNLPDITHLTLGKSFSQSLDKLPKSLTNLTIYGKSNQFEHLGENLSVLKIKNLYNGEIVHYMNFPLNLKKLSFTCNFTIGNLPPNLLELNLGQYFNGYIKFPESLQKLTFGYKYSPSNILNLSNLTNLTHLFFGKYFNCPIDGLLPINLKYLEFSESAGDVTYQIFYCEPSGSQFNHSIDMLPSTLTHLYLSSQFNKPIKSLPKSLTHLIFGHKFNHEVNNLPKKLKELTFGREFNKSVDNLPLELTYIKFGLNFNNSIDKLPSTLSTIILSGYYSKPITLLPINLQMLSLGPTGTDYTEGTECSIHFCNNLNYNFIDTKLKHLEINLTNMCLDNLPKSLEKIVFNFLFESSIDILPSGLKYLIFNRGVISPIDKLPEGLIELKLFYFESDYLIDNLPKNLQRLTLIGEYNKPIDKLPQNLKYLRTNCLTITKLPDSITHLTIESDYLPTEKLPKSLKYLQLAHRNFSSQIKYPRGLVTLGSYFLFPEIEIPPYISNIVVFAAKTITKDNQTKINLPATIKKVIIKSDQLFRLGEKIPWGCKIETYKGDKYYRNEWE